MPAAIVLGTSTFTMSALPGTPSIQNAIPMPFFGTTPFAAPGLGILASLIMFGFGLWWLNRQEAIARRNGESFGDGAPMPSDSLAVDENCANATTAREFDPAEIMRGRTTDVPPPALLAALPLITVIICQSHNVVVDPAGTRHPLSRRSPLGRTSLAAVGGVGGDHRLACAILTVLAVSYWRLPALRATMDAASTPRYCRRWAWRAWLASAPWWRRCLLSPWCDAVLSIGGGPLVSLAVATNVLAALTGSASAADHCARRARATYMGARRRWLIPRCCIASR